MKTSRKWIGRVVLGALISSLETSAAPAASGEAAGGLSLNFSNAPLSLVLEYLSDAGGFVINAQTEFRGTLDLTSKTPLGPKEAIELVNAALKKNGCALARHGRILTLMSLAEAGRQDLEVVRGNQPEAAEKSSEVITQIIPVRYVSAAQLVNNLRPLLPASAALSVNESANALILVAAKADVRRALQIVAALDFSPGAPSRVNVFPLRYADAKALATVVQQLFSTPTSGQSARVLDPGPGGFGRGGGFGPPGMAPDSPGAGFAEDPGAAGAAGAALGKGVATADEPSNSLLVSAPAAFLTAVSNLVAQIDLPVNDITELRVFRLANADPLQLAEQLAQLFQDTTANSAEQNQMGFFFDGPPGAEFESGPTGASPRAMKKSRVLAVGEPRTSSLLVSAPSTYMPQITKLIEQLDARPDRKEKVHFYELQNADPQNVSQVLEDLFNRGTATRNNGNNRNSLLGQGNPLLARQTQQLTSSSRAGQGFGNSSALGMGGAGAGPSGGAGGGGGGGGF